MVQIRVLGWFLRWLQPHALEASAFGGWLLSKLNAVTAVETITERLDVTDELA